VSTKLSDPQKYALRAFESEDAGMSLWDAAIEVVNPRTLRALMQLGYIEGNYLRVENANEIKTVRFLVGFRLTEKGIRARREAIEEYKQKRREKRS